MAIALRRRGEVARYIPEPGRCLRRLNQRKWGRVWECDELLDLVEDFERTVEGGK